MYTYINIVLILNCALTMVIMLFSLESVDVISRYHMKYILILSESINLHFVLELLMWGKRVCCACERVYVGVCHLFYASGTNLKPTTLE